MPESLLWHWKECPTIRRNCPGQAADNKRRGNKMSDLDQPRAPSRTIWIAAAIGAVAVHVCAIALALASMQSESPADLGAPAIEIGIELAAPRVDLSDLPVGPDTQAAAASPAVVEQKTTIEHRDVPKATPTETDDPDRVVAPSETKKPEDVPKMQTVQANPSTESVAAEDTATPILQNAVESLRSVAPAPGTGESAQRERVTWQRELAAHFNKYKRYPQDRAMRHAEVVVSFVLDRIGHVLSAHILKGSGDPSFDAAALDMLRRSDPVPPPPPLIADDGLSFALPVIFHVKDQKVTAGSNESPK
jgi:periplasmic protein TonB